MQADKIRRLRNNTQQFDHHKNRIEYISKRYKAQKS